MDVEERALIRKKKKKSKVIGKENEHERESSQPDTKIEDLLKAVVDKSKSDGKKRKTKKKTDEEIMLQTIKKGTAVKKDNEDSIIAANIYNEDESPRTRKNNKNARKAKKGIDNDMYIEETALDSQLDTPKKPKKKKKLKVVTSEDDGGAMTISELEDTPRKKTKKKKPKSTTVTEDEKTEDELDKVRSADETTRTENEDDRTDATETSKVKGKKKKKKKRQEPVAEDLPPEPEYTPDDGTVLGINIHRTDSLKTDLYLTHPVVRVHLVDLETGKHVTKQTKGRPVTYFYEKENDKVDYVLPMMTQPFDFKKRRSMIPAWEELLLFNENYSYFIQLKEDYPKVIVFFELLDFISMNAATYNNVRNDGGWHRVAWAFLKIVGSHGAPNTGKKIRLQLFYPPVNYRAKQGSVEVYQWWLNLPRQPYPSTLYVTLKGLQPPNNIQPAVRSFFATQEEEGTMTYKDLKKSVGWGMSSASTGRGRDKGKSGNPAMWSRLPGQTCHVPNKPTYSLSAGRKGCFVLKFSHDGRSLACGGSDKASYPIYIYEIPSGRLRGELPGHYSIIYDLCWSDNDQEILSASSDGTARIWDTESVGATAIRIFPHPAYVYTAQYHPQSENIVVTGGFDHVIRVWNKKSAQVHGELLHELIGHKGYINCLCFSHEGDKLYSADSVGSIIVWNASMHLRQRSAAAKNKWSIEKTIAEKEMEGVTINSIKLHPGGTRLLVHGRDNNIRMIDLRIYTIMQRYLGALNFREQLKSSLSACGTFVFSGSEDYQAYVWNTDTGDQVAIYSDLGYTNPVSDVAYHPFDHMIAFCSFGENHPVQIYNYDAKVAQIDLGIRELKEIDKSKDGTSTLQSTGLSDLQAVLATKDRIEEAVNAQQARRMDQVSKKLASVNAFSRLLGEVRERNQQEVTCGMMGTGGWAGHSLARKGPNVALTAGPGGKASFSFNAPLSPLKDIKHRRVVSLYDYNQARSDELNLLRGDVITVLHQDNENWWLGELVKNGQQGYFPANYVTPQETMEMQDIEDVLDGGDVNEKPSMYGTGPSESDDLLDETPKPKKRTKAKNKSNMSAVVTATGELKILSGPEDTVSEMDIPTVPARQKKKRVTTKQLAATGDTTTDGETPRKPKPKRRGSRENLLDDDETPRTTSDTEKKGGKRKTKTKHIEKSA
uniref:Jouberin-like n=1 Tax=Saccoglossus kowalevskii TaxID=10224 RepID=A0ABM0MYT8_SACKO|nr:PREDICTED: jouberin-like [Saccoglossus kowalevskii]